MAKQPKELPGSRDGVPLTLLFVTFGRFLTEPLESVLSARRLTPRHLGALGHIARQRDVSFTELARRAGVTVQSIHATVTHLEGLGAVARSSIGRGRGAGLAVTDSGRDLLEWAFEEIAALDDRLFSALPRDDQAELVERVLQAVAIARTAREDPL
jgi:DNA-binding MarR family transcriptional regulator